MPEFQPDFSDVLNRAKDAGVEKMITIGIDTASSREAVKLAGRYEHIFATVGIHPCDSADVTDEALAEIAKLAAEPKVVAIGETGLDFYHKPYSESTQRRSLEFHLDLALRTGLPVVIHSRQADDAILPLLLEWAESNPGHPRGVIHCFGGSITNADKYLAAGFYIALGGYVSYPSAQKSHEVFRHIPLDRLLLETDCPFLPPQRHRGQRNEPAYIAQTAEALADIRGITVEELAQATTDNTERLFNIGVH